MSLVISDDFLQTAHISEVDLKLEIAIVLFQQQKITLGIASQFAEMNQQEFQRVLDSRKTSTHNYDFEDIRQDFNILENNSVDQADVQPSQAEILQRIEQRRAFCPAQYNLPDTLTLLQEDRAR